jgi:hypothetical protein
MANRIYLPYLNSIKLVVENLAYNYNLKHLDDALLTNQIYDYQTSKKYFQKFQNDDLIYFQIVSNFGSFSYDVVDCNNNIKLSGGSSIVNNTFYSLPFSCYEASINISTLDEGEYYIRVKVGFGSSITTLISEPISVSSNHINTALFSYRNSINTGGAIFQNNETFHFRCEAVLQDFQPQSIDTVFEDQNADLITLSSFQFRTWKLLIGAAQGVPDWVIDKLSKIFGVDTVLIDGKQYVKQQGSKFEVVGSDRLVPLRGWSVEVRESKARSGVIIDNDMPLDGNVIVEYIIDPLVFGNIDSITILKVE